VDLVAKEIQAARSRSWEDLTPAWAKEQKLPKELLDTFPEGRLGVRVEPVKGQAGVKRVTVAVRWRSDAASIPPTVIEMTALFSARAADSKGGE